VEDVVAAVGADGQGLGVVLEGVGWGFGALVGDAEELALLDEGEGGVGADVDDAAGLHVAGDAEVAGVGLLAHRVELGDGDVVALGVAGSGDGEPGDSGEDYGSGDDELGWALILRHLDSLARLVEGDGEGAFLGGAFAGQFEEADDAVAVFGGDG